MQRKMLLAFINTLMKVRFAVIALCLIGVEGWNAFTPRVETKFGQVEGKWSRTVRGRPVANYLGIPYAMPPIGELRFRNPVPWNETWPKAHDGTKDGPMCLQKDRKGKITGREDCLYLNLFVPLISGKRNAVHKLPVIVYLHGGGFNTGSSDSRKLAPDYLLDQNLVLVTINYRLNVFGFLSTANKISPGNYGLKDIVLALKWIQENIAQFSGDPDSVTLWGHSAGAAAAHLLALTNKTEGLFARYIMQSGSALGPWAVHPRKSIRKASIDLATHLGCLSQPEMKKSVENLEDTDNFTTEETTIEIIFEESDQDDEDMISCLRSLDARTIVRMNKYFERPVTFIEFGPTIEDESDEAIVTMHPWTSIENKLFRDVPWVVGVVEHEGLLKSLQFFIDLAAEEEMVSNFEAYLPYLVEYHESVSNSTVFASEIEKFYFGGNVTTGFMRNITELVGDGLIVWPTYKSLKYQSQSMKSSTYFYVFSYEGTFTSSMSTGIPIHYGISHADDLNYLFPYLNNLHSDQLLHNTESDVTMINIMTEMWSSFAVDGVPRAWRVPQWPNYNDEQKFLRLGLDRSPDIVVDSDFLPERMSFWEKVTENFTLDTVDPDLISGQSPSVEDDFNSGDSNREINLVVCNLLGLLIYFL